MRFSTRSTPLRLLLLGGLVLSVLSATPGHAATKSRVLFDFETTTAGWGATTNIDYVDTTRSMRNEPYTPFSGAYMLQAKFGKCFEPCPPLNPDYTYTTTPASADHTISWTGKALNLKDYKKVTLNWNSYGMPPSFGLQDFRLVSTVTISSGASTLTIINKDTPYNKWTAFKFDISNWPGRFKVTGMSASLKVPGAGSYPWAAAYQIDQITAS